MRAALFFLLSLPAWSQLEPCGFFEIDERPGFNSLDFAFCASNWLGSSLTTDFNNDGVTNLLDMVQMSNCRNGLSHGLIGSYYGFNTGHEPYLTYPDFSSLPNPVVVRATESLNHEPNNWRSLMDSGMSNNTAAVFEGYLFAPQSGSYDFQLLGYSGMKLFIENQYLAGFENGWINPVVGSINLSYGLHPVRVEFFTADHPGSIVLQWRETGSPVFDLLTQTHFYHDSATVPEYAGTGLECLFEPSSGGRTEQTLFDLSAYFMGPDTQLAVTYDGQDLVLKDGLWENSLLLEPGLNHLVFHVTDGQGRQADFNYNVYCDQENLNSNGLVARLYGEIFDVSPIPDVSELDPFVQVPISGSQLSDPYIGGTFTTGGVVCHLEGTIQITQSGIYEFRISNTGSLRINGESICNLDGEYRGQWQPNGSVFLEPGNHHYHIQTASTWQYPEMGVYWTPEGGTEVPIPNSQFHYADSHFLPPPEVDSPVGNGRVTSGLLAEYLLRQGSFLEDSSGKRHPLDDDPRVKALTPGGAEFSLGGGFSSEQGGVHCSQSLIENNTGTFEVEFIWEGDAPNDWDTRPILAIFTSSGSILGGLFIRNHSLYFEIHDQNDWQMNGQVFIGNFLDLYQGQRVHVMGRWNTTNLKIYVNGQQVVTGNNPARVQEWPRVSYLGLGTPSSFWNWGEPSLYDSHFNGKILMAALYDRALSSGEINSNYQANQVFISTPPNSDANGSPFPPPGVTQSQLEEAHHVLNRLSFGPNQASLQAILSSGVESWISDQLDPSGIDDSVLENLNLNKSWKQKTSWKGFADEMLTRATLTERQFNEVLTQFWDNHFNTEISKTNNPEEEWLENRAFRKHALGNFKDLLLASATGYTMNVYLDNIYNVVGAPNENYAREILELHTFGVNNGYTQDDIVQAARCFTGWTVDRGKFAFDPGSHDYGEKNLLGLTIPAGGGLIDGMLLIDALSHSQNCADFISRKLCQLLIADDPPADIVAAASSTFGATNGNIKEVINTITSHSRFRSDTNYRQNKVKTPLEFMISALRATESAPVYHGMYYFLDKMGMDLFNYPFPTGFEETGAYWVNTNSLLYRWNFVHHLTSNRGNSNSPGMDIVWFINSRGLTDSADIMDLFEGLSTHGRQESTVKAILADYMTHGDPGTFSVTPQTLDQEVRQTQSLFLRLPEFNRQ